MIARTDQMIADLDDLCEHPLLIRVGELGIVGYSFRTKEEVSPFPDAWYLLSVDARAGILKQQLKSVQTLIVFLQDLTDIDAASINSHALLQIVTDAAHVRISSIADLTLILAREIFEIELSDVDTSFGNLRRLLPTQSLLAGLGRLTASNRPWRLRRNKRFHSGFRHEAGDLDTMLEFGSLWRERGFEVQLHSPDGGAVTLQELFNLQIEQLMQDILDELNFISSELNNILNALLNEFELRFKTKANESNSLQARSRRNLE